MRKRAVRRHRAIDPTAALRHAVREVHSRMDRGLVFEVAAV